MISLSFKQLDGECRQRLIDYVPLLHTVGLIDSKKRNRRTDGLLRRTIRKLVNGKGLPKDPARSRLISQSPRTPGKRSVQKTEVSRDIGSFHIFRDGAAGDLQAIWAKLPQSWV